jgi:predicted regulator of Ras-like GTPase activity (Roadblock/LC7/MglB family)
VTPAERLGEAASARGEQLGSLLSDVLRDGGFSLALLGDRDGFPVASAVAPGENEEASAAAVALMQRSASEARAHLGLGTTDEIMLHDELGRRLVCRPFRAGDSELILIVIVPGRRQPYRKVTNRAVREFQRIFDTGRE